MAERPDFFLEARAGLFLFLRRLKYRRTAGVQQLPIRLLARLFHAPVDIEKLGQRAPDLGRIQPHGDEAALPVQGVAEAKGARFQVGPVRTEGIRRHTQDEDAGGFEPVIDLFGKAVAGFQNPIVEPHAQPVRPQALGDGAHDGFVLGAVAQEYVVLEMFRHGPSSNWR